MTTQTLPREDTTATDRQEPAHGAVHSIFATIRRLFGGAEKEREQLGAIERGTWELTMAVEPDETDGGYIAECLEVPGAMGQGETEEAALRNLSDAISAIVEVKLAEESLPSHAHDLHGRRVVNVKL
jgi:predicted RNase H-like HicB family nuclease